MKVFFFCSSYFCNIVFSLFKVCLNVENVFYLKKKIIWQLYCDSINFDLIIIVMVVAEKLLNLTFIRLKKKVKRDRESIFLSNCNFKLSDSMLPQRVVLAIMGTLAIAVSYTIRSSLPVAINEMVVPVNNTAQQLTNSVWGHLFFFISLLFYIWIVWICLFKRKEFIANTFISIQKKKIRLDRDTSGHNHNNNGLCPHFILAIVSLTFRLVWLQNDSAENGHVLWAFYLWHSSIPLHHMLSHMVGTWRFLFSNISMHYSLIFVLFYVRRWIVGIDSITYFGWSWRRYNISW